ncbi:MAG: cupin domain-containing protein [Actinomycetota bacterium]
MSYLGETGEASAVYRHKDAIPTLKLGSTTARLVAPGSLTGDRYGLFRWDMDEPAGGAGPHFHRTFSESFYILAGTVQLYDGTSWVDASPGDFIYVPEGGVHGFRNDEAASMLILFAPGPPRERYFEELAAIIESGRQLSDEEWTELYARHDQYMV